MLYCESVVNILAYSFSKIVEDFIGRLWKHVLIFLLPGSHINAVCGEVNKEWNTFKRRRNIFALSTKQVEIQVFKDIRYFIEGLREIPLDDAKNLWKKT